MKMANEGLLQRKCHMSISQLKWLKGVSQRYSVKSNHHLDVQQAMAVESQGSVSSRETQGLVICDKKIDFNEMLPDSCNCSL